jgi:hypothetical protein
VERKTATVEVFDNRIHPPVAVLINNVSTITVTEEFGVEARIIRDFTYPRAKPHLGFVLTALVIHVDSLGLSHVPHCLSVGFTAQ